MATEVMEQAGSEMKREDVKEYPLLYPISVALMFIAIALLIGAIRFRNSSEDYLMSLFTDGLNIIITVVVLDRLNEHRQKQAEKRQLQTQLIWNVGSTSNQIAVDAVHQLRKQGWLSGKTGLLSNIDLENANLEGARFERDSNLQWTTLIEAKLGKADLRSVDLQYADLDRAKLQSANLGNADLRYAHLLATRLEGACLWQARCEHALMQRARMQNTYSEGAFFGHADLSGADLTNAIMRYTHLGGTDFRSAILRNANFVGSDLPRAELNRSTILPDGNHWKPGEDLSRFTNPDHPNFWYPAIEGTPSYETHCLDK